MTVVIQTRDRCRICFSLLLRDRSSLCCQKSYNLFKQIERRKFPIKKSHSYQTKIRHPTVCFHDLILRYLHTQIPQIRNYSNLICSDCSMVLLDVEQCAKYLRKTINQLKLKLNKSNRLRTSSLSATFQKKNQENTTIKQEQLPISNSDSDEEFDDIDDDEDDGDEEIYDDTKNNIKSKSLHFTSPSSSGGDSLLSNSIQKHHSNNNNNNHQYNENDDEDEEDGLIKPSSNNLSMGGLITTGNTMNLLEETNPNLMQLRFAQMMSSTAGQNFNDMNAYANIQRNFILQFLNDQMTAAQVAATAAATAISSTPIKANITSVSSNNKQIGSGRKRKSTPEKRRLTNNNGEISPIIEQESFDNNHDSINHPLELTIKNLHQSNRNLSSDIHNLVTNSKFENGSSSEDHKEIMTPNDSSLSLSPSLIRRPTGSKRQKLSPTGQYDYSNKLKIHLSQTSTTDLLSPNHQLINNNDDNNNNQSKQQRKLDPRPCAECGKVLFSDKTHLLHCQTHAKNEKQCWICGINDDDIKKHIINEHGNQKFTDTGFKCQHCEKVFPVYADLQAHMREHSKKKPFECPICNKRFGQQGNLSCHLRIHSGVKPFTCTSCGKAFRHSNSLRRHARTVHSASRGLSMSPRSVNTTPSSLLLATATTSNSMVSMPNDMHRLSTSETFDDATSGLMIQSDEAESLQGPPSISTTGAPSPTVSNAQMDSDSHEQYGTS